MLLPVRAIVGVSTSAYRISIGIRTRMNISCSLHINTSTSINDKIRVGISISRLLLRACPVPCRPSAFSPGYSAVGNSSREPSGPNTSYSGIVGVSGLVRFTGMRGKCAQEVSQEVGSEVSCSEGL